MNSRLGEQIRASRRHAILAMLAQAGDYVYGETTLAGALRSVALRCSQEDLRKDLRWLADRGLLTIDYDDGPWQAKLLRRGKDVAEGLERVDGVAPPPPE